MRYLHLFILLLPSAVFAQFQSENIGLYSQWIDSSRIHDGQSVMYNSVWGYYDPAQNREYAIMGGNDGTYIIEVTNPSSPILRSYIPGRRGNAIWREYKNYNHYLYMISDDSPPNSFQIADLSYLPDSVHLVHDSDSIFPNAHTLYIDGDKLYCASVKRLTNEYYPIGVYSLSNPEKPLFLRNLNQDYPQIQQVHDMFVRNDTVYASAAFQGLQVFTFTAQNKFNQIGSLTSYPDAGYNHSSWLTDNGKTMVFCDEVPENLTVKVIDVSDIANIEIKSTFKSNEGATPHNPHIIGNTHVAISYYEDGIQIFDISNPSSPFRSGFFDTHPQNQGQYLPGNTYNGCWGTYPYLPSGTLLASDRQNGLFILDPSQALTNILSSTEKAPGFTVFPVPVQEHIYLYSNDHMIQKEVKISLYDISGRIILTKTLILQPERNRISLEGNFPAGLYLLEVSSPGFHQTLKLIKN
jgi:choice-of-anchor B domain-containing protein